MEKDPEEPAPNEGEEEVPTTIPPEEEEALEKVKTTVAGRDVQEMMEPGVVAFLSILDKRGEEIKQLIKKHGSIARVTVTGTYGGLGVKIDIDTLTELIHPTLAEIRKYLSPDYSKYFDLPSTSRVDTNAALTKLLQQSSTDTTADILKLFMLQTPPPPPDEKEWTKDEQPAPRTDGLERDPSKETDDAVE